MNAVVENVVVSQTGDLERDPGQAGDMGRQTLEDRAALPNGLTGRRQRAFTVDDPQVGVTQDGQHVSVNAFGGRPDHRLQGPDRRPVAGDEDRDPAAIRKSGRSDAAPRFYFGAQAGWAGFRKSAGTTGKPVGPQKFLMRLYGFF